MQVKTSGSGSERVLIHAPFGRDGALIRGELLHAGFSAVVCKSVEELCALMQGGAGAALIADEALVREGIECLAGELSKQPPWSNFPLLVMTSGGAATRMSRYRLQLLEPLGNVTLLERPLRPVTLISSLRAALRARRHQYQLCELLRQLAESNQELKRANDNLTRVNRELEEFAWVASHDLQEPLRMVNIYTHLLLKSRDQDDEAKRRQYRDFISEGINRMGALINDLLTFSRTIQTQELQIGVAELSESLRESLAVLNDLIEESGASIAVSGPLPRVRADSRQMSHVFQNLLSNSIKYCRKNVAPEIRISAEQSGDDWIVAVRDNGIGFEQQYADRIFGLFKRLHKDEYPGTGLGLAICQRIVERFGGRIWASSKPGCGATFFFTLPRAEP